MSRLFTSAALAALFMAQPAFAADGVKAAASEWISDMGKPACKDDPAWRFSTSESCEAQSGRIGEPQRQCFLSACLEKMSSPELVRQKAEQKKRAACEQNAKNLQLGGSKRDGYIKDCLSRNEVSSASKASAATERKSAVNVKTPEWIKNAAKTECTNNRTWSFAGTGDCEDQAQHVKAAERHCFIEACLNQRSSPEQVRQAAMQKKRARCEQNAKNMEYSGAKRDGYIAECVNKNEAVQAAGSASEGSKPLASESHGKKRNGKHADKCSILADEKGLKGTERKKAMAQCQKNGAGKSGGGQ